MRFWKPFLLIFIAIPAVLGQTAPERDVQVWSDTYLTIPLMKKADNKTAKLSVIFGTTFRLGRNAEHFVDERVSAGFEFRVNRFLTIAPAYLYRADQPIRGRREWESRIRLDIGLEKQFKGFSIKDRNRIEHRFRNFRSDTTRYRNKIQLSFPVKRGKTELFSPFIADEPYFEFQSKKWTRNEFSAGISRKLDKAVTADFYYLLQNNRGTTFKYVNVFGVTLKIKIDR